MPLCLRACAHLGDHALISSCAGLPICAAFLLLYGADATLPNRFGQTPIDVANLSGNVATEKVLRSSSEELFTLARSLNGEAPHTGGGLAVVCRSIWEHTHQMREFFARCRSIPL
jgi:hypothetical protein